MSKKNPLLPVKAVSSAIVPVGERELARRLKEGDRAVYEIVIDRLSDKVYRFALYITGNESDALDVTQETFLTLLTKIKDFREESSLSSWLFKIAFNYALMNLRERVRTLVPQDVTELSWLAELYRPYRFLSEPESMVERLEMRDVLLYAMKRLDVKYRAIFLLSDVEGLSLKDIAIITRLSIPAVKTRLHRARLFLRKEIAPYLGIKGRRNR